MQLRLNRRSFWGLIAGLFTTVPFLHSQGHWDTDGFAAYNKEEWTKATLRSFKVGQVKWNCVDVPYDPYDSTWCKEWGMFGPGGSS